MTLTLKMNEYFDDEFIEWLIDEIRYQIYNYVDSNKLDVFNNYIKESEFFSNINKKSNFDIKKIVILSLNALTYRKINNVYIIEIEKNKILSNYNIKLETICRILNNGNTDIKGYPIYSKVFNHIKSNIAQYYEQYLDE